MPTSKESRVNNENCDISENKELIFSIKRLNHKEKVINKQSITTNINLRTYGLLIK